MSKQNKIWYSFMGGRSVDDSIGYYDAKDFPLTKLLEDNFLVIEAEVKSYIENNENNIKPYFNKSIVTKEKSWRSFAFIVWSWNINKNLNKCPNIKQLLNDIPEVVSASVSIMEPGVAIKPHRGDTNTIIRVHLGIEIPEGIPGCGFEVNGQKKSWEPGKVLMFNDAALHSAWNYSNKRRYVLIVDIVRSKYIKKKQIICAQVLGGLILQSIFQKLPFLKRLPRFINIFILYVHVVLIIMVLSIRKTFNF